MSASIPPEPWLRGPVDGVPPVLQPAAHAIVMAREDIDAAVAGLAADEVWATPGGAASIGFHLAHLAGSTDRLLTYARGEALSAGQKAALVRERSINDTRPALNVLLDDWHRAADAAIDRFRSTDERTLFDARAVGKAQLPSTVIGLIFHAAEHAARHTGQIVTTAKIVRRSPAP
jgi:uncharacterized damage-inducible protein DinB